MTALILPVAHFGHWYVTLLYMAPVVVLVAALSFQSWRDKRRKDRDDEPE
ncbi:MAG: hypothetical protein QOH62_1317 [Solirubrobacteraceae bacterium]|nr:hypothetical protein [Solirubrobacteraceae bacterium]